MCCDENTQGCYTSSCSDKSDCPADSWKGLLERPPYMLVRRLYNEHCVCVFVWTKCMSVITTVSSSHGNGFFSLPSHALRGPGHTHTHTHTNPQHVHELYTNKFVSFVQPNQTARSLISATLPPRSWETIAQDKQQISDIESRGLRAYSHIYCSHRLRDYTSSFLSL